MIPNNYHEWQDCIQNKCKISITSEFVENRLSVYCDNKNPETIKFKELYGQQHLENIINWLEKAK